MINPKPEVVKNGIINHGGRNSWGLSSEFLDFSSNISPLGMPKNVKNRLKNKLEFEDYPDINSTKLLEVLGKYTKLPKSNLIVGNGATELIYNFCQVFLSQKIPVLIPIPTFGEYESAAKLNGAKIIHFKTLDLSTKFVNFIEKIPKNGCVFICNPNNPTGKLIPKKIIKHIIIACKKKSSILFVDECFIEMTPEKNESILSWIKNYNNLIVLRSLTKCFGLAGIRLGYAASNPKTISALKNVKIPWSVNSIAQQAGILCLKNLSHLDKTKSMIKTESQYLKKNISKIEGFDCLESSTNFLLVKTNKDSTLLQKKLLKEKILIRDCKNFLGLGNKYIRIAVKTRKENYKLIKALEKL